MKKRTLILSFLSILMVSVMLFGCDKKDDEEKENVKETPKPAENVLGKLYDNDLKDVETAVTADLGLPKMIRVEKKDEDAETIFGSMIDFPYENVEDFVYLYSEEGLADEILLIKFNTTKGVLDVKHQMQQRVSDRRSTFETYNPSEVNKCDGAKINFKGNFAAMIICERATYASQEFLKLFDKE